MEHFKTQICIQDPYICTLSLCILEIPECNMPQNAAFHQGLRCLLGQKLFARTKRALVKEMKYYLEIITCDPFINKIYHTKFKVLNQKEESISTIYKRVKDHFGLIMRKPNLLHDKAKKN